MSYILVTSRKHTGAIFAIIGFIGLFAPLTDCSSMQEGMIKNNLELYGFSRYMDTGISCDNELCIIKKKYKLFDVNDGHAVYCHYRYQSSSIASAQACNSPSNAIAT